MIRWLKRMKFRPNRSPSLALGLAVLLGPTPLLGDAPATVRVVIEFTESVVHPETPGFIEALSDYAGVPLTYLRSLPNGGHVLQINRVVNDAHLARVIRQLSRHGEVAQARREPLTTASPDSLW